MQGMQDKQHAIGYLHDFLESCCICLAYAARLLRAPLLLKLSCMNTCCFRCSTAQHCSVLLTFVQWQHCHEKCRRQQQLPCV